MTELLPFVDSAMARSSDMGQTLATVCTDGQLRDHLLTASKDLKLLSNVLCYRHPNGFYKMKLISPGVHAWALRIHIWDAPTPISDVHNHRWNFASFVISGRLRESQFTMTRDQGQIPVFQLTKSMDGRYTYSPDGRCNIREVRQNIRGEGESYSLDHKVLHSADPESGYPVITAVLQGRDVSRATTVIPNELQPGQKTVKKLNKDEISHLMELATERFSV